MRLLFLVLGMLLSQFTLAQGFVEITPENAADHGITVQREPYKLPFGNGYKVIVKFPPIKNGAEGLAIINVAYAGQPEKQGKTVQIPQFKGMALVTGDASGMHETFVIISYSRGSIIEESLYLHLKEWVNE